MQAISLCYNVGGTFRVSERGREEREREENLLPSATAAVGAGAWMEIRREHRSNQNITQHQIYGRASLRDPDWGR